MSIALVSITAQVVINCKVVVRFHQYSLFFIKPKNLNIMTNAKKELEEFNEKSNIRKEEILNSQNE